MEALNYTTAIKLLNLPNGECTFQYGKLPNNLPIDASHFWLQKHTDEYELKLHVAPAVQYVITLKGRLRFTVSDGSSFIVMPGILLIATDVAGPGHSWELLDGDLWERIYIPIPSGIEQHFIMDEPQQII